jgi:hypothetical protein
MSGLDSSGKPELPSSHIPRDWTIPKERRNPDGSLNLINGSALEVGDLTNQLVWGYFSYLAALTVASDPRAEQLMPARLAGKNVSEGVIHGKYGNEATFHFEHYLRAVRTDAFVQDQFSKAWLAGAIITIGDALSRHAYFNHQPELELVYHLRNGIAHGNQFNIDQRGEKRLAKYPAHNKAAIVRVNGEPFFEITKDLNGMAVLFDFVHAGDVVNILQAVGAYCRELAYGTVAYRAAV